MVVAAANATSKDAGAESNFSIKSEGPKAPNPENQVLVLPKPLCLDRNEG